MKTISIVIPVFNEEKRLKKTFQALMALKLNAGLMLHEVIFVNDGSDDNTLSLIKEFARTQKKLPISIISYAHNKGKGYAVKQGMLASTGDYALLCDADMSTPFSELAKFHPHIHKRVDLIIGTRKNGKSTVIIHQPKMRELLGKAFTFTTQKALQLPISDFTCGFKLFSKQAVQVIFSKTIINRWGYDAEVLYLAKKNSLHMVECPVVWSDDKGSHVRVITAIPQTLIEVGKIMWAHSLAAQIGSISALSAERVYRILSFTR